jgi:GT2 family glycosyltransferase
MQTVNRSIMQPDLSVSLVAFHPDWPRLAATIASFARALAKWMDRCGVADVVFLLVDNTPVSDVSGLDELLGQGLGNVPGMRARVISGHGNIGFGRGHNLVLPDMGTYHLILNPDLEMAEDALSAGLAFLELHPECGLLTPAAYWEDGSRQYLCKQYPSILDLLLRGFAPAAIRDLFRKRLDRYEMRDLTGNAVFWNPPIVSGCFMLFRGDVLRALGGFDPGYFLYYEDFDLSLRTAAFSRIAFVPSVKVVHHGGHAARKGWRHVAMFGRSAIRFFGTHGWRLL